ncbi:GLPGLI family protein [Ornithobacterium rhinotracheale]|uniref:GLPGLI family protein n=1 Tax=Ornithobacterium rhinotracheale TaxID=28251 RepID=UPI00129C5312|nr:GLPGLI family protein [Ornithobacterium rhinotracheale]MCK0203621.1 GLPGLI family protein [Ornithobacterium rhinotracheale]MCK0204814.1 GLPGLI family protein [Ornithobacterium rhinotracheale]MRI63306.1 GLPGLI family protein [Ornithobacterium rhinotracheale]MRJ08410.1 GLPGLI family protein [Ornithobacterium rhinotracheale]MRJ09947.1 GLPGLI family protein [Ornithobacterium rhinotracheale]
MKRITLNFLVTFLPFVAVFAQQKEFFEEGVEVEYQRKELLDPDFVLSTMPADLKLEKGNVVKQELKAGVFTDYVLKSNIENSTFHIVQKLDNSQSSENFIKNLLQNADKGSLYKDFKDHLFLKELDAGFQQFLLKDSLMDFNWELINESKHILGYKVKKAIGKVGEMEIIAWYAPKLPIKDGPDRFCGLPGLILELQYYTSSKVGVEYLAKAIQISESIKIEKPSKGKVVTSEELKAEFKRFREKQAEMQGEGIEDKD